MKTFLEINYIFSINKNNLNIHCQKILKISNDLMKNNFL